MAFTVSMRCIGTKYELTDGQEKLARSEKKIQRVREAFRPPLLSPEDVVSLHEIIGDKSTEASDALDELVLINK